MTYRVCYMSSLHPRYCSTSLHFSLTFKRNNRRYNYVTVLLQWLCHHLYYVLPASSRCVTISLVCFRHFGFINLNWLFSSKAVEQKSTARVLRKVFKTWTKHKTTCSAYLTQIWLYLIVWGFFFTFSRNQGKRAVTGQWLRARTRDLEGVNWN